MSLPSLALVALLAAEPSNQGISLAAPGFQAVNVNDKFATFASDHFAASMTAEGIRVMTSGEVAQVIGLERQKQLLGCSETGASCMAELAGALGTDGLITGSIGKFGTRFQVSLKVLSSKDAAPLAVTTFKADNDEQLMDSLANAAEGIAAELFKKLNRTPQNTGRVKVAKPVYQPASAPPANITVNMNQAQMQQQAQQQGPIDVRVVGVGGPSYPRGYRQRGFDAGSFVNLGIGAALIGGGFLSWIYSEGMKADLRSGDPGKFTGNYLDVQNASYIAWVLPGLGAAAGGVGALMILTTVMASFERVPLASIAVSPNGMALVLGGTWE